MPLATLRQRLLPRLRQWKLAGRLAREAGWRHLRKLALLSLLSSGLDIAGLGIGVSLLPDAAPGHGPTLPWRWSLPQVLIALVGLMLMRGLLQAWVAMGQERLRSGFTDVLRQQLLAEVLTASSTQLEQLGRGELLGLLMADISRSVLALDQGVRALQGLLALALYAAGVLVVGRESALTLLLAITATGAAALMQRSGSWTLGRLQTQLNGAIQRTVGDGLHGLKAVRAAAAESWLLQRFAQDNARFRQVLQQTVRRQALFTAWRDTLVVLMVGLWLLWGRSGLTPAAIATTLLLAYRSGSSLSAVIQAQRLCLGALPGYEALCDKRERLRRTAAPMEGAVPSAGAMPAARAMGDLELIPPARNSAERKPLTDWQSLHWRGGTAEPVDDVLLRAGTLVAIVGPSGSGKTTLLDRVCGLLGEHDSHWQIVADGGDLTLGGIEGARQLRRHLAYAPQEAVLFETSLRRNLLLDQAVDPHLLDTWLLRLGLSHLAERAGGLEAPLQLVLDQCSGGELHRLGLLRAWLRDCPVEVLDEPTAFLDAASAEGVRAIITERAARRLVLVSTHDPALIEQADRVIRLEASDRQAAERQHHARR